jgi:hypothetical protein
VFGFTGLPFPDMENETAVSKADAARAAMVAIADCGAVRCGLSLLRAGLSRMAVQQAP